MGNSDSTPKEEIVVTQQQQQQAAQPTSSSATLDPVTIIAVCAVLLVGGYAARFMWKLIIREIEIRAPRRATSTTTIV